MKLLAPATLLLAKLVASSESGYSSVCKDDGMLEITIPYTNGLTAELLRAVAGDCDVRGASSDNHNYAYDEENSQAVLNVHIANCGMNEIYHESKLRSSSEYFMATANVTIGVYDSDNDRDLIFYNAVLGAECGQRLEYTVVFDYKERIQKHEETDCHEHTPDGQCIVAAYDSYHFVFREYETSARETLAAEDVVHQANTMIHLQIEALDLPDHKKFAVKKCDFVDIIVADDGTETTERYQMFNAADGVCDNRYIDLSWGYDFDGKDAAPISHRLFLLKRGDQDSYHLECDVKVCDKDDAYCDCNKWTACLESSEHRDYVCEGACESGYLCDATSEAYANCYTTTTTVATTTVPACDAAIAAWSPDADDIVIGQHADSYEGLTQIDSKFVRSAPGAVFMNKFTATHGSFGIREHYVNYCITCTSDGVSISMKDNAYGHMTMSAADLVTRYCVTGTFNWRGQMCSYSENNCNLDWSTVTEVPVYNAGCDDASKRNHGIFVNTEVYDRIGASCSPYVAVRTATETGDETGDVKVPGS